MSRIAVPSPEDMLLAAQWLEMYEDDSGDSEACERVAAYLRQKADDSELRQACKEAGVSVWKMRKIMKKDQNH